MDPFFAYIDGLGRLDDSDLYMDIDKTMVRRAEDRAVEMDELKSHAIGRHKGTYNNQKRSRAIGHRK